MTTLRGEIVLTLLLRSVREVGRGWQILLPSLPLNPEAETLGDEPAYVVELREYSKKGERWRAQSSSLLSAR